MTYRFNTLEKTDWERFDEIISRIEGRLKWVDLVRKPKKCGQLLLPFSEYNFDEHIKFKSMTEYNKYKNDHK